MRETANETREIETVLARSSSDEDALVEIVGLVVRVAQSNDYIRYLLESDEALKVVATYYLQESSDAAELLKDNWREALQPFVQDGQFGAISLDEAISWINFCLIVLLRKADMLGLSDEELKHFIRMFVLKPIFLNQSG